MSNSLLPTQKRTFKLKLILNIKENIEWMASLSVGESKNTIEQALEKLHLTALKQRLVKDLSAGQKRRVSLARLLLKKAALWILDEPFSAVDVHGVQMVIQLMQQHVQEHGMVVLTNHQLINFGDLLVKQLALGDHEFV